MFAFFARLPPAATAPVSHRSYSWGSIVDDELGTIMGYLVLDALLYALLFWY